MRSSVGDVWLRKRALRNRPRSRVEEAPIEEPPRAPLVSQEYAARGCRVRARRRRTI